MAALALAAEMGDAQTVDALLSGSAADLGALVRDLRVERELGEHVDERRDVVVVRLDLEHRVVDRPGEVGVRAHVVVVVVGVVVIVVGIEGEGNGFIVFVLEVRGVEVDLIIGHRGGSFLGATRRCIRDDPVRAVRTAVRQSDPRGSNAF